MAKNLHWCSIVQWAALALQLAMGIAAATCCCAGETNRDEEPAVRKAIAAAFSAAAVGDAAKFKDVVYVRDGEQELADAAYLFMRNSYELKKQVLAKFGEPGLVALKKNEFGRGVELHVPPVDAKWVEALEITFIDDDTAVTNCEFTKLDIYAVKKQGKWRYDILHDAPRPFDAEQAAMPLNSFANALRKGIGECEREDSTIKDVVFAVTTAMFGSVRVEPKKD